MDYGEKEWFYLTCEQLRNYYYSLFSSISFCYFVLKIVIVYFAGLIRVSEELAGQSMFLNSR